MKQRPKRPKRQQGVAMLTAMLIVALAVVVVTSIFVQQRYSIRLTHNIQDLEQAYQYAYAAEKMAAAWLKQDVKERNDGSYDSLHDNWAAQMEPFEIDDEQGKAIGQLDIHIDDLQAYFNINNLYDLKTHKARPGLVKLFQRLLQEADIPVAYGASLVDWMDADQLLSDPDSAESDFYLAETPPYRAANALLTSTGELSQIKMGFITDPKEKHALLAELLPHVVVLPTPTALNVNTAPESVLSALGLSSQQVQSLLELRRTQPIRTREVLAQQKLAPEILAVLGVSSNYFRLSGQVRLGKSRLFLNSVLFRSTDGEVRVIMRQFTRVPKPAKPEGELATLTPSYNN